MYHAYRLQVIADRHLLIPHTLAGVLALLAGPIQFSSRLRRRHLKLHRVLGRSYVASVFVGALTGIALSAGRPGLPGTCVQAAAWIVCTGAALITARNRQIDRHRQWMVRSYAVTFTFVSSRVLNLWPLYWSHLGDSLAAVGLIVFTLATLLVVEIGLNWREIAGRRARWSPASTLPPSAPTRPTELSIEGHQCPFLSMRSISRVYSSLSGKRLCNSARSSRARTQLLSRIAAAANSSFAKGSR
jgi:uncharacterized membrane protein